VVQLVQVGRRSPSMCRDRWVQASGVELGISVPGLVGVGEDKQVSRRAGGSEARGEGAAGDYGDDGVGRVGVGGE
jgi:hypothetical protein